MENRNSIDKMIRKRAAEEKWTAPDSCKAKTEQLLQNLPETMKGEHRVLHFPTHRAAILAAALVAVAGMTVGASELFQWNPKAVEHYHHPTQDEQNEMTISGIAREQEISVTDAGITITARQTVQDSNCLYILLEIQAEEHIFDGNGMFSNPQVDGVYASELLVSEDGAFNNISMGFTPDTPSFGELSDHGYYEIFAMKALDREWSEETVMIQFGEYSYYTYENGATIPHTIEGDWLLELPLGEQTNVEAQILELNKEVDIAGIPVMVKRVELSPLSLVMVYDMDDLNQLQEALYSGQEDVFIFETQFTGFLDQNGEEIACGWGGMSGDYDFENREIIVQMSLSRFVDVEAVSAVLLGEEKVSVPLN